MTRDDDSGDDCQHSFATLVHAHRLSSFALRSPSECYRLSRRKQIVAEYFDSVPGEEDWSPHYNIAPTQSVPIIRQNAQEPFREFSLVRWGLIPSWAKDETAGVKPAFRDPLKTSRCIISADAFYEWQKTGKAKQPYCFEVNEGELFAFAGIWDRWKEPNGKVLEYYPICLGRRELERTGQP